MIRKCKGTRIIAGLLVLALMLTAAPVALAESFYAYVKSAVMQVYSDAAMTAALTVLPQFSVVSVQDWSGGGAVPVTFAGQQGYASISDMQALAGNASKLVLKADANLYQTPTEESASVAFTAGTEFEVLLVLDGWTMVAKDGAGGYIRSELLATPAPTPTPTPIPAATPTPVPAATPAPAVPVLCQGRVVVSWLPVYAGTSASTAYLGRIASGTVVNVIETGDYWAHIELNGAYGYCSITGLALSNASGSGAAAVPAVANVAKLTVYTAPGGTYLGSVNSGTCVNFLGSENGWAYIELNGAYGYCLASQLTLIDSSATVAPTAVPAPANSIPATVAVARLMVYSAPGGGTYLGVVNGGAQVNYLGVENGWAYIELNGAYGYCLASQLSLSQNATLAPTVTPAPTPTPNATSALPAVANVAKLMVYSAPGGGTYLGWVAAGTRVNFLGSENGWAYIELNGAYGYCLASSLSLVSQATLAPTAVPTATPDLSSAVPAVANVAKLMVYSAPNGGTYLGWVASGTRVNFLGSENGWAYIELNGAYGYCLASQLTLADASATAAPTAPPAASIPAQPNVARLMVYSAPGGGTYLGVVTSGTQVNFLGAENGWAYIELNGAYGYCLASQLTLSTAATAAPTAPASVPAVVNVAWLSVYAGKDSSTQYLGRISYGTEVNVLETGDYWAYIELNGAYGYCMLTALTLKDTPNTGDGSSYPATVTAASLPVYSAPSTAAKYLGSVSSGTVMNVLNVVDGWAYVELNGAYGWCDAAGLAATGSSGGMTGYISESFSATVVSGTAKFYSSANTSSASISLPRGMEVAVSAYNSVWAYGVVNGVSGYALIADLSRTDYSTLDKGSSGNAVTVLQMALLTYGYYDATAEATYAEYTASAVRLFQSACGLTATGIADQTTQRILYSDYAPKHSILYGTYVKGNTGNEVSRIQLRLFALGYLSKAGSVDGDFGNNTYSAVYMFQQANGINPSGTADPATLAKLYSTGAVSLPSGKSPADSAAVGSQVVAGNQQDGSTAISSTLASTTTSYHSGMSAAEKLEYVIYCAQNQLGKPYVWGTEGMSTFDCTGLTYYAFKQIGIKLKRTAVNQGYDETYTKITGIGSLQRGDLVFFNTVDDGDLSDHAGIYLGAGFFIHASSGKGKVIISTLTSGYYNRVFSWGRRPY